MERFLFFITRDWLVNRRRKRHIATNGNGAFAAFYSDAGSKIIYNVNIGITELEYQTYPNYP